MGNEYSNFSASYTLWKKHVASLKSTQPEQKPPQFKPSQNMQPPMLVPTVTKNNQPLPIDKRVGQFGTVPTVNQDQSKNKTPVITPVGKIPSMPQQAQQTTFGRVSIAENNPLLTKT